MLVVVVQVFLQAESVNLSAAIEEGDAYLLRRDDAKRRQQRAAVDATLDDESEAVAPFPVDDSAAVEADRKWRQQCMLDALASSGCEGVGHPSKGRVALDPQITLALRDCESPRIKYIRTGSESGDVIYSPCTSRSDPRVILL